MTSNNNNVNLDKLGLHIYTGGVGLQEAVILFFFALAIRFHWTLREQAYTGRETDWKALLYVLYASLTLITVSNLKSTSSDSLPVSITTKLRSLIDPDYIPHSRVLWRT